MVEIDVIDREVGEGDVDWVEVEEGEMVGAKEAEGRGKGEEEERNEESKGDKVEVEGAETGEADANGGDKDKDKEQEEVEVEIVKEWEEADQRIIINVRLISSSLCPVPLSLPRSLSLQQLTYLAP